MSEPGLIALLFGGRSVEHDVSIRSARSVLAELERQGWVVLPVAVDQDGRWFTSDDPLGVRQGGGGALKRTPTRLLAEPGAPLELGTGAERVQVQPNLYFPLIHGFGGEDGTLQGLLELASAPYAGSGVLASALAMDKDRAKAVLQQAGLPVVPWTALGAERWQDEPDLVQDELEQQHPGTVFIKPANGGSSVGISKAGSREQRSRALHQAFMFDTKVIVEQAVDAREVEVSVLGNERAEASVPGEIVPCRDFYDYQAKYDDDATRLLVPADLEEDARARLSALACESYQALGCAGFGRVDFLIERTTGRPFISELNTLPGFTDVSMFPQLWQASGLSYGDLLACIIDLGQRRHRARQALSHIPPG